MENNEFELLKIIYLSREGKTHVSEDFQSLERKGFDKGYLRKIENKGLIHWTGIDFILTERGEEVYRQWLIIESSKPKQKTKIILDTDVLNKLADNFPSHDWFDKIKQRYEVMTTHIQIDQLNNCEEKEKRGKLSLVHSKLSPLVIPTESGVFGLSRFGEFKFSDDKSTFQDIQKGNLKHNPDALIGETAIKQNLLLITNDVKLKKKVNGSGGKAINLEDFNNTL
jgi:rRNA-processing protein FCF1